MPTLRKQERFQVSQTNVRAALTVCCATASVSVHGMPEAVKSGWPIRELELAARFPRLHRDIETTIFRIIQEALTNVQRHSEAKSARVEIEKQSEVVKIRIRDYGKGLPAEVLETGNIVPRFLGVGLSGMRERTRQFGGELSLSREQPGTMVEATIPLFPNTVT